MNEMHEVNPEPVRRRWPWKLFIVLIVLYLLVQAVAGEGHGTSAGTSGGMVFRNSVRELGSPAWAVITTTVRDAAETSSFVLHPGAIVFHIIAALFLAFTVAETWWLIRNCRTIRFRAFGWPLAVIAVAALLVAGFSQGRLIPDETAASIFVIFAAFGLFRLLWHVASLPGASFLQNARVMPVVWVGCHTTFILLALSVIYPWSDTLVIGGKEYANTYSHTSTVPRRLNRWSASLPIRGWQALPSTTAFENDGDEEVLLLWTVRNIWGHERVDSTTRVQTIFTDDGQRVMGQLGELASQWVADGVDMDEHSPVFSTLGSRSLVMWGMAGEGRIRSVDPDNNVCQMEFTFYRAHPFFGLYQSKPVILNISPGEKRGPLDISVVPN